MGLSVLDEYLIIYEYERITKTQGSDTPTRI